MRIVDALALVVRHPEDAALLLAVLRPEDDRELPGVWGLPAVSLRRGESVAAAALRLGRSKLGCGLRLGDRLAEGAQQRSGYRLRMAVHEATLAVAAPTLPKAPAGERAVTSYSAWQWASSTLLVVGAEQGSLCCRLVLDREVAVRRGDGVSARAEAPAQRATAWQE